MSVPREHDNDKYARQRLWAWVRLALVGLAFVAALTFLLIVPLLPTGQVTYEVGDVARADIRSPRRFEFDSTIESDLERDRAAAAVAAIYDPPETRVARQQISRAQEILAYMTSVRQDVYARPDQRLVWIEAIPDQDLQKALTPEIIQQILGMSGSEWVKVRDEVVRVLDQAMRNSIREDELDDARGRVQTLVDVRQMDEEEIAIVSAFVRGLLVPNTFVNVEVTESVRQQARDSVQAVREILEADEIVLREGDTITERDLEALEALGLLQTEAGWREVAGVVVLVLFTTAVLALGFSRYQPNLLTGRSRRIALVGALYVAFVLVGKFMVPGRAILPYLFPAAGLSMTVTVLLNPELAIVISLTLAILVGQITGNSLELAIYVAAAGLMAALVLRQAERVNAFFRAGVYVGITNVVVILVYRLPDAATDPVGMLTLIAVGLVNGALAASVTLAVFFIVGNVLDITTSLKLLELSQPSHPLLRKLLLEAPGTYHHTLMIASLAEQAAERIGANALLTRVGAYYHDVGKTRRPHFFTENQMNSENPHDRLDPYTSADILSGHVTDGLELAKRYRLPSQVRAFISEHHGDAFISFMYQRAVDEAGGDATQVPEKRFRYVGPKPQSRETALLMLADTAEAMAKSKRPASVEDLEKLIDRAIRNRMDQGQLDECDLTLRDLVVVRESFVDTLKGLYHERIDYPEPKTVKETDKEPDSQVKSAGAESKQLEATAPQAAAVASAVGGLAENAADGIPSAGNDD